MGYLYFFMDHMTDTNLNPGPDPKPNSTDPNPNQYPHGFLSADTNNTFSMILGTVQMAFFTERTLLQVLHWCRLGIVFTGTVHRCNETLKAACAAVLSLKSQQDAERAEHRRYNSKARDEVTRLQRHIHETDRQLKLEAQKVCHCGCVSSRTTTTAAVLRPLYMTAGTFS